MTQLFTNRESMPKVLIVQSDDAGIRALRVCVSLGLKFPRISKLYHCAQVNWANKLTPQYPVFVSIMKLRAQMVAEMVPQVINDPIGSRSLHRSYQSVLAFRDSFKNPYLVK